MPKTPRSPLENLTTWVGSISSLIVHTLVFAAIMLIGMFHILSWDTVLLVLTTAVSLEAIYLAIFIQMSVNQQAESLREVEEDIDEIQEDVDEIQEDVGEIQEDIDEIQEDVDEIQEDVDEIQEDVVEIQEDEREEDRREREHRAMLIDISAHLQKLLTDIEKMKKA